jgi:hypothetical protein
MSNLFVVCVKKKYGYMDDQGTVVIPATHQQAGEFVWKPQN